MSTNNASADITQLRWQQIRAVECQITVEKENVELRKQIASLQQKLKERDSSTAASSKVLLQAIAKMVLAAKHQTEDMRIQLATMKELVAKHNQRETMLLLGTIKKAVQKYSKLFQSDQDLLSKGNYDRDKLKAELSETKKALSATEDARKSLADRYSKARDEAEELIHSKNLLAQDCSLMKARNDELQNKHRDAESRLDAMSQECARLRQKLSKLELSGVEALTAAMEEHKRLACAQDLRIHELMEENEGLKATIANLKFHVSWRNIFVQL